MIKFYPSIWSYFILKSSKLWPQIFWASQWIDNAIEEGFKGNRSYGVVCRINNNTTVCSPKNFKIWHSISLANNSEFLTKICPSRRMKGWNSEFLTKICPSRRMKGWSWRCCWSEANCQSRSSSWNAKNRSLRIQKCRTRVWKRFQVYRHRSKTRWIWTSLVYC